MHVRSALFVAATLLFAAGAIGLVGLWALATAVVVLVGTSVATVIAWEEPEAPPSVPADLAAVQAE